MPDPLRSRGRRILDRPYHPVLFAAFPVLFLVSHNIQLVALNDVVVPGGVVVGGAAILYLVIRRFVSKAAVAALRATVIVVWFFAYGHISTLIARPIAGLGFDRHLLLLPLWTLVGVALIILLGRTRYHAQWTRVMNLVGIGLVGVSALWIATNVISGSIAAADRTGAPRVLGSDLEQVEESPDIYYVVFDRYAEASSLKEYLDFDNEPFLNELRRRGFVIPSRSLANYKDTLMSLASTLNMGYLDWVADRHGTEFAGLQPLQAALRDHEVGRVLRSLGYRYLHIGSWWEPTRTTSGADHVYPIVRTSEFLSTLRRSTVLEAPISWRWFGVGDMPRLHREVVERQFKAIRDAMGEASPKFVFVHVLLPHPPYVFKADGGQIFEQPTDREGRKQAYVEQLLYTNTRILEVVDDIQRRDRNAVIILQADEGPNPSYSGEGPEDWTTASVDDWRLKLRILNAVHVPNVDPAVFGATFSSVNTFRVLLKEYFEAGLAILDDASFVSSWEAPYQLVDVTEHVR